MSRVSRVSRVCRRVRVWLAVAPALAACSPSEDALVVVPAAPFTAPQPDVQIADAAGGTTDSGPSGPFSPPAGLDATAVADTTAGDTAAPDAAAACPDGAPCDDGNACTTGETCLGQACQGGQPKPCPATDACHTGQCDLQSGDCVWQPVVDGVPCLDGTACTTADVCVAGICTGQPLGCDDGNPCTADGCVPAVGCVWTPIALPCQDGNACTAFDTCNCVAGAPGGATCACVGKPLDVAVACDDGQPCTTDACQSDLGCTHLPNALPCDDGSPCTQGDTCGGGACMAGAPVDCDDGNACTADSCDGQSGCQSVSAADGSACGAGQTCQAGQCASKCKLFEQVLGAPGWGMHVLRAVTAAQDGGWLAVGQSTTMATGSRGWAVRFDAAGKVLWNVAVDGAEEEHFAAVDLAAGGTAVAVGSAGQLDVGQSRAWAARLGEGGAVVWQKTFGPKGMQNGFAGVAVGPDGGFVAVGNLDSQGIDLLQGWVLRADAAGSVLWQTTFGGLSNDFFKDVLIADGALLVSGLSFTAGEDGNGNGWLARLDGNGNLAWQQQFGGPGYDTLAALAGSGGIGYAIGTTNSLGKGSYDGWLVSVQASGKYEWQKTFGGAKDDRLNAVAGFNGGVVAAGWSDSFGGGDTDGWIVRTDGSGKQLWQKTLGGPKNDYFYGAAAVLSGGVVLVGTTPGPMPDGGMDAPAHGWVVRIDSAATSACQ